MSPLSPEDPLDVEATTPVPPPVPVLPQPDAALPASAGRRFSASTEPGEVVHAAPRRSAASASSPGSALEPVLPPVVRPTAPPAKTVTPPINPSSPFSALPRSVATAPTAPPDAPAMAAPRVTVEAAAPAEPADQADAGGPAPEPRERSRRPAIVVIAAVAVVVALVSAAVWWLTVRSTAPSGGPTTTGTAPALDPLLTAADLGTLGGVTWVGPATADGVRPLCLPQVGDGVPAAQRSDPGRIGASSSPTDAVIQVVDTYADEATAMQAYAARLAQAGTCADAVALITGANTITGLADSADLIRLTVQDEKNLFHSLLLTRSGRTVNLVDVSTSAAVPPAELASVAAKALSRQCSGGPGTCPGSIEVAATLPPPGNPVGWLVQADLPRITPAAGRWGATQPQNTLDVVGSQCEALNLKGISGATAAAQRTLLLADDSSAPRGFGVDQVVYTFPDAPAAESLAKRLAKNLNACPDRAPTATVEEGPAVKGSGAQKVAIGGSTFLVTQKTETNTVVFRVAVVTVGSKLVYLLANPSTTFDFSEGEWTRLAVRAGQRASQAA